MARASLFTAVCQQMCGAARACPGRDSERADLSERRHDEGSLLIDAFLTSGLLFNEAFFPSSSTSPLLFCFNGRSEFHDEVAGVLSVRSWRAWTLERPG